MSTIEWRRSPELNCWVTSSGGVLLTVSRLSDGRWQAEACWHPWSHDEHSVGSPSFATRKSAQAWAERQVLS